MKLIDVLQGASNAAAQQVSGNVDLIAAALRAMGVPVPQAPVMSTDWLRQQGLYKDVEDPYARAVGESAGIIGPMVAAAKAPQIAGGLLKMGENAAARQIKGPSASQRGIFIGPNAKTWDKAAAAQAEALEKAGADPRDIWQQTGTFRGPDGMLRQEISDDAAQFKIGKYFLDSPTSPIKSNAAGDYLSGSAEDILNHPDLFKSYPEKNTVSLLGYKTNNTAGEYRNVGDEGFISLQGAIARQPVVKPTDGPFPISAIEASRMNAEMMSQGSHRMLDPDSTKSTLLHELQHAIQQREGWARGGSPQSLTMSDFLKDKTWRKYVDESPAVKQAADNLAFARESKAPWSVIEQRQAELVAAQNAMREKFADDAYKRLAGEAEARAVQSRMNLTPAQRRGLFPFDSYDVPVDQLIVRKDGGTVMNATYWRAGPDYGMTANTGGPTFFSTDIKGTEPFKKWGEPRVADVNPKRLIDASRGDDIKLYDQFLKETGHPAGRGSTYRPYWTVENDFIKWLRAKGHEFDAVMFDEPTNIPSLAVYDKTAINYKLGK